MAADRRTVLASALRLSVVCACAFGAAHGIGCKSKRLARETPETVGAPATSNRSSTSASATAATPPTPPRLAPAEGLTVALSDRAVAIPAAVIASRAVSLLELPAEAKVLFPNDEDAGRVQQEAEVRWLAIRPRSVVATSSEADGTASGGPAPMHLDGWPWTTLPFEWAEIDGSDAGATNTGVTPFYVLNDAGPPGERTMVLDDQPMRCRVISASPDEPPPASIVRWGWPRGDEAYLQPDPTSPAEAFRRALLLEDTDGSTGSASDATIALVERPLPEIIAANAAGRWFTALERLQRVDPALTRQLLALLTRTCWDGPTRFAAWPADPEGMAALESILLSRLTVDEDAPGDEAWRNRIVAWIEQQPRAVFWIEADHGLRVHLAVANFDARPLAVAARWPPPGGARPTDARTRVPFVVGPVSVRRIVLDRPVEGVPLGFGQLHVEYGARTATLGLDRPTRRVEPPGASIATKAESWSVASWTTAQPAAVPASRDTTLTVRRAPEDGRWELVIEAIRAPAPAAVSSATATQGPTGAATQPGADPFGNMAHWRQIVGVEAVTLFVGPFDQPLLIVSIAPGGAVRGWERLGLDEWPPIRIDDTGHSWTARLALPDVLIDVDLLDVGFVRTHAGLPIVDCAPRSALPWRGDPGRVRFDLGAWDVLPGEPVGPP